MKKVFLSTIVCVLLALLTVSVFAVEGDYGYYDRTEDGKIGSADVLLIVKDILNKTDSEVSLIHALRTLKITVTGELITAYVKSVDYTNDTVTVFYKDCEAVMSFSQLGLDKKDFIELYEEGLITMTVPSPAKDFFASFDYKSVYAAYVYERYDTSRLEFTIGEENAILNGEKTTLFAAPVLNNGVVMIPANTFKDVFETEIAWDATTSTATFKTYDTIVAMTLDSTTATVNGEETSVEAPLMFIDSRTYVPAKFVAEALGAKVIYDAEAQSMTIIKQFYPTLIIESASGTAGSEVTVNVSFKHNPGFAGLEYRINYDSALASYVSGKSNTNSFFSQFSPSEGANPVKAVLANLSLKNISGDLSLATITFKLADDAISGTVMPLTLSDANAYDAEIIHLKTILVDNTVTVE